MSRPSTVIGLTLAFLWKHEHSVRKFAMRTIGHYVDGSQMVSVELLGHRGHVHSALFQFVHAVLRPSSMVLDTVQSISMIRK